MCGICGYITKRAIDEKYLYHMNQEIAYRGPDDEGYYFDTIANYYIGLAHRRLSILDLSSNGHQPMISEDGNIIIVFNGEIYNFIEIRKELEKVGFHFNTDTDTEVIIKSYIQWGIEAVSKFNGMFAFALFDKNKEFMYLVRDRIGVKPLYYYENNNDIVFASELKPIMKHPDFQKEIDFDSLSYYLAAQYIPGTRSIFKNVYKLLPGTILKWTKRGIEKHTYWSIRNVYKNSIKSNLTYKEAKIQLSNLLTDSIKLRMISDVPLGAFLSNGVDSSLMVAYMQELSQFPINTFTVGFVEDGFDESKAAEKVAHYLGTQHTTFILSHNEGKKLIKTIPVYYDEPMADASQIATMLVSQIARQRVTVAISGDAGDELFCGYNKYDHFSKLWKYNMISKMINLLNTGNSIKKVINQINNRDFNKIFWLYDKEILINADVLTYWDRYHGMINGELPKDTFSDVAVLSTKIQEKAMLHDLHYYLPDDILCKVDRASMSVSLECRAPLLDYRIVEFALSLPLEYKYKGGVKKRILKDLLYTYVPQELIGKTKKGFGIPFEKWLHEEHSSLVKQYFSKEYIQKQGIFNFEVLDKILNGFKRGKNPNYAKELWTLYVFQMWHERYMIST